MWKSKYREAKNAVGEKIGKAVFYEVGVTRIAQRSFKRTFRRTLEHSTPRKAHDCFSHQLGHDEDFRNRLYLEQGWSAESKWLAEQDALRTAKEKNVTFEVLYTYWRTHASAEWSAKYAALIESFWRELKDTLKDRNLNAITKVFLTDLDAKLREGGNSRSTVNRKIAFILRVTNYAFKNDLIEVNPLAKFDLPPDPRPKNDFWSEDEARHFLSVAESRYPVGSPRRWVYVAYLAVLNTGIRANELWALKPGNLRLEARALWLTHQWNPILKTFTRLKSKDDGQGRAVPMNDVLYRELLHLQRSRKLGPDDLFFGIDVDDPWHRPWCKPGASPVDQSNFSKRAWRTDLRLSGNRRIRFHDLRHSAATMMRRSGASRDEVRSILGHSDAKTTARYDHAADDSAALIANRFVIQPSLELLKDDSNDADAS
jgi:integrase